VQGLEVVAEQEVHPAELDRLVVDQELLGGDQGV
jgi:hypothetical protein